MATIPVEKELLEDLLNSKIQLITQRINNILDKWKFKTKDSFLEAASNGTIEEAEMDAISLTNLIDRKEDLMKYKVKWSFAE